MLWYSFVKNVSAAKVEHHVKIVFKMDKYELRLTIGATSVSPASGCDCHGSWGLL